METPCFPCTSGVIRNSATSIFPTNGAYEASCTAEKQCEAFADCTFCIGNNFKFPRGRREYFAANTHHQYHDTLPNFRRGKTGGVSQDHP